MKHITLILIALTFMILLLAVTKSQADLALRLCTYFTAEQWAGDYNRRFGTVKVIAADFIADTERECKQKKEKNRL